MCGPRLQERTIRTHQFPPYLPNQAGNNSYKTLVGPDGRNVRLSFWTSPPRKQGRKKHQGVRFLQWEVLPSRIGESKKGHWATLPSATSGTFSGARTGRHLAVKVLHKLCPVATLHKLCPVLSENEELADRTAKCCAS